MDIIIESEVSRIRTDVESSQSIPEMYACYADVDVVADAIGIQAKMLERKFHRLQGEATFKSLGIISPDVTNVLNES